MTTTLTIIAAAAAAAILAALVTLLVCRGKMTALQSRSAGDLAALKLESERENATLRGQLQLKEAALENLKETCKQALKSKDETVAALERGYQKNLEDLRAAHAESLKSQADSLKSELAARTEELLRQREAQLSAKAKETFENISGSLGKDIAAMKEAFEANKKSQTETGTSLKAQFDNAVKQLESQSRSIGEKTDDLCRAMRGGNKFQGIWGETILLNILTGEGFVQGRDFDKEDTIRDAQGNIVRNETSYKKMRPDYVLHFADNQDVIVDCKVSLSAFADYIAAEREGNAKAMDDARRRNLESIRSQYKNLNSKDYSSYLKNSIADFVIMFVPNSGALQLALDEDPALWRSAYEKKVLITSQETILPFLRMIHIGWRNVTQAKNQEKIIEAAGNMMDRVADFTAYYATIGKKLEEMQKAYNAGAAKLSDRGQSILTSARQVKELGVKGKKDMCVKILPT